MDNFLPARRSSSPWRANWRAWGNPPPNSALALLIDALAFVCFLGSIWGLSVIAWAIGPL